MRSFIKLILISYNVEYQLFSPVCFELFILALSGPRKFATIGLKMAIDRSKVML